MIEVDQFIFSFVSRYFLKKIENMLSVILLSYRNEESSKKLWKHSAAVHVPTAFHVPPNFHLCFYNLIETRWWLQFVYQ